MTSPDRYKYGVPFMSGDSEVIIEQSNLSTKPTDDLEPWNVIPQAVVELDSPGITLLKVSQILLAAIGSYAAKQGMDIMSLYPDLALTL